MTDHDYMALALAEAKKASQIDEVPVGAVVVLQQNGVSEVVATAHNTRESAQNPLGHAEVLAIHTASQKLGRWRLSDCTLYVTLEPCLMCSGAIVLARLGKVVYGATDPKAGAVTSLYQTLTDLRLNHRPQVVAGVMEVECGQILKSFFAKKRGRALL
jgi:tRNA(adenine34) deaminase